MAITLELQEQRPASFDTGVIPVDAAVALARSGRFQIDWPSPENDFKTVVTPQNWIGHFPAGDDLVLRVAPKVPIARLFEMLEVAYNLRSLRLLDGTADVEGIDGLIGRLASILARRVLDRARRGLYGGYREERATLAAVRGRIDVASTLRDLARGGTSLHCTYDDHSRDLEDNRLIFWTLHKVSRLEGLRPEVRSEVMGAYRAMRGLVTLEPCSSHDFVARIYNRLNEDYQPMHALSRLLLEHMGPGIEAGDRKFIPFMLNMPNLFEAFMARWLPMYLPASIGVDSQYHAKLVASQELEIRVDLLLRDSSSGESLAVLDTKYKDTVEPSFADIQQAAFYANEMNARHAFLIYPSSATKPMWVKNGAVTIQTLVFDLSQSLDQAGSVFLRELHAKLGS